MPIFIDATDKFFVLKGPDEQDFASWVRAIPDRRAFSEKYRGWICAPTQRNVDYLHQRDLVWKPAALHLAEPFVRHAALTQATGDQKALIQQAEDIDVKDFPFYTKPYLHQKKVFALSRDLPNFMFWMEQRTGKSKVLIDTVFYRWRKHDIDACVVVCPNSVKSNWADEQITAHLDPAVERKIFTWDSTWSEAEWQRFEAALNDHSVLVWFIINYEAISSETFAGYRALVRLLAAKRILFALDESSRIKHANSKRTRNLVKLGRHHHAVVKRLLTGTPITQGLFDAYPQAKFLDENILGFSSFTAYKRHFAVLGGQWGNEVLGYTKMDELQRLLDPYMYRVLLSECSDVPDTIYTRRSFDLSPAMREHYDNMAETMLTEFQGEQISVLNVLVQLTRLQQIVGGFLPVEREDGSGYDAVPIPGPNAKLDLLMDALEDESGKAIIWARFRPEIAIIAEALEAKYGPDSVVQFHGDVSTQERTVNRRRFQDVEDPCRWLIGNADTGGLGLDLSAAQLMVFFSNSFNLETRLQAESRQLHVTRKSVPQVMDLVARNTCDVRVLRVLRDKKSLAGEITGDNLRELLNG